MFSPTQRLINKQHHLNVNLLIICIDCLCKIQTVCLIAISSFPWQHKSRAFQRIYTYLSQPISNKLFSQAIVYIKSEILVSSSSSSNISSSWLIWESQRQRQRQQIIIDLQGEKEYNWNTPMQSFLISMGAKSIFSVTLPGYLLQRR